MAVFRVGQRVRIVSAPAYPGFVGNEAVISESFYFDGCGRVYRLAGYVPLAKPHHIEPIIDAGNKAVAWSECLWNPEHIDAETLIELDLMQRLRPRELIE